MLLSAVAAFCSARGTGTLPRATHVGLDATECDGHERKCQHCTHCALPLPWFQPRQCQSHTRVWLLLSEAVNLTVEHPAVLLAVLELAESSTGMLCSMANVPLQVGFPHLVFRSSTDKCCVGLEVKYVKKKIRGKYLACKYVGNVAALWWLWVRCWSVCGLCGRCIFPLYQLVLVWFVVKFLKITCAGSSWSWGSSRLWVPDSGTSLWSSAASDTYPKGVEGIQRKANVVLTPKGVIGLGFMLLIQILCFPVYCWRK